MIDRDLPLRPGGTAPHVLVEDLGRPRLREADAHHLRTVRRLRDGDLLSVTDGAGGWRWCAMADPLTTLSGVTRDAPPVRHLTVCFALVKGQKPELVVQKLTELGIDSIQPFVASRSVVRWTEDKGGRHHDRLIAVAREAAQQSRRTWFPTVGPVVSFGDVATRTGAVVADLDGRTLDATHHTVLIGPEGGWADDERILPSVGLGSTVLRSETAAIAAATLMTALRDGRVQ